MRLRVRKSAIIQYLFLYLMLIFNQSNLYRYNLMPYRIIILGILLITVVLCSRRIQFPTAPFLLLLLFAVIWERIYSGGTGMETFADYSIPILATVVALQIDRDLFLTRMIKLIVFIATASLIGTVVAFILPDLLKLTPNQFVTGWGSSIWTSATDYTTIYYKGYGLFLFSWIDRAGGLSRNIGIFTEPGIYQMVLNSAVFILLYLQNYTYIEDDKRKFYLGILIITIATCMSTSGYLGLGVILLGYVSKNKNISAKIKNRVLCIVLLCIAFLASDWVVRKDNSVMSKVLLEKLFTESGNFSLAASSSGMARLGTITTSIMLMIKNPLGLGTKRAAELIKMASDQNVAGALFSFGAVMGIIPLMALIYWIFKPVVKWNTSGIDKIVFAFLYLNTVLAQSSVFYPTLIMIPLCLTRCRSKKVYEERGEYSGNT